MSRLRLHEFVIIFAVACVLEALHSGQPGWAAVGVVLAWLGILLGIWRCIGAQEAADKSAATSLEGDERYP